MRVAITGVGGGVGQAVIRSLQASRLPLQLIGLDASTWSAGLYQCDFAAQVPFVSDGAAYLTELESIISRYQVDALIPGTDTELYALALARDRLAAFGCRAIVSTPGLIAAARDKVATYQVLARAGIPFVQTMRAQDFAHTCTAESFPAILKPKDGSGSTGTHLLFSPEDLTPDLLTTGDVVQEYLVPASWGLSRVTPRDVLRGGRMRQDDELSVQGLVAPDGTVVGVFTSVNELRDGVVMKVRPMADPRLLDLAWDMFEVLAGLGHVGPCNIEGRLTRKGPRFYEINPRFTGVSAARAEMGFNECEAALRLFVDGESPASVARDLRGDTDLVCLRYMTEQTVRRLAIEGDQAGVPRLPAVPPRSRLKSA